MANTTYNWKTVLIFVDDMLLYSFVKIALKTPISSYSVISKQCLRCIFDQFNVKKSHFLHKHYFFVCPVTCLSSSASQVKEDMEVRNFIASG